MSWIMEKTWLDGWSLLHDAAWSGQLQTVKFLTEHQQLNIHQRTPDELGFLPIHFAVYGGHLDVVQYFLSKGVAKTITRSGGETLLHEAASAGCLRTVKFLTEQLHLNVHQRMTCKYGALPIHIAAQEGHLDIVQYFLSRGVDKFVARLDGCSLLYLAAYSGHLPTVKYLTEHMELNVHQRTTDEYGALPIHMAAQEGHLDVIQYFLSRGVDKSVTRLDGWSLLHEAALRGHLQTVMFLTKVLELDVHQRTTAIGTQPIHLAAWNGHGAVVRYLISHGADPHGTRFDGWTVLHVAAYCSQLPVVDYCINELHLDVTLKDKEGRTPLNLAKLRHDMSVVQYLKKVKSPQTNKLAAGLSRLWTRIKKKLFKIS